MTPEQIKKLSAIEEELVDVFLEECKPGEWPGMDESKSRGDRYWYKKNALATLTLAGRIQTVLRDAGEGASGGTEGKQVDDPEAERAREAKDLERLGIETLERHRRRRAR